MWAHSTLHSGTLAQCVTLGRRRCQDGSKAQTRGMLSSATTICFRKCLARSPLKHTNKVSKGRHRSSISSRKSWKLYLSQRNAAEVKATALTNKFHDNSVFCIWICSVYMRMNLYSCLIACLHDLCRVLQLWPVSGHKQVLCQYKCLCFSCYAFIYVHLFRWTLERATQQLLPYSLVISQAIRIRTIGHNNSW